MPVVESARAYIEPAIHTEIMFEGKGYTKVALKEGTRFWMDSEMALYEDSFPREFEGFEMLIANRVPEDGKSNGGKIPLSPLQHVLFHNNPPGKLIYYKFSTLFSAGKGETCKIYVNRRAYAEQCPPSAANVCCGGGRVCYRIKQISPVAPSFTIRVRLPRNFARTSSGVRTNLEVRPS